MATSSSAPQREHDVIVYGATGFTGRLACEYLLEKYPQGVKWAMAGRSRDRLTSLQKELGPKAAGVPLIVADALDAKAVDALAASTRVVANFAGTPFMDKALPLVAACCKHGTHYVDITGEVPLQRASYDRHHKEAVASGSLIVHNTGYDSVPSDLGALLVGSAMREQHGMGCSTMRLVGGDALGGVSGGTLTTLMPMWFGGSYEGGVDVAKLPGVAEAKALGAYPLEPEGGRRGPDTRHSPWPPVTYDKVVKQWVVPNVMASINAPVVRKTNALLGYRYGEACSYHEVMGLNWWVAAAAVVSTFGLALALLSFPPTRWAITRFILPAPGQGPSKKMRENGFFNVRVYGVGERSEAGSSPPVVTAKISSGTGGDPGYKCTALMCMESALCLALEREKCAAGGVLTPASAMGMTLVNRLNKAGMVLELEK